jgi:DNA polymerase-3 subunit delta
VIHLFYGKDRYRIRAALRELRAALDADGMLESNTTVLDGASLTPDELMAHATAVPFLASSRLVIVEGLIGRLGSGRRPRRTKKDGGESDPLEAWRAAAAQLADPGVVPGTTTVVFLEGELDERSAALAVVANAAQVRKFDQLRPDELAGWVERLAAEKDVKVTPRALAALAQLVGPDLWALDNELDKLGAYCDGAVVDEAAVDAVVTSAREARIWDLTDAVVSGNEAKALSAMRGRLTEGDAAPMLSFMIVREYRQIAIVKDLLDRGARRDAIARDAGLHPRRIDTVLALARRFPWSAVRRAYDLAIAADLSVKRGLQDDEAALQTLIHQLCAIAPRAAARAYAGAPAR